jgi:hypothetical protein
MLHVVHQLQRRFPEHAQRIANTLVLLSASALLLGAGVLILR